MNTPKLALSLLLVCAVAGRTVAQTADQLIAKHILAMGGEEKWKNIKSLVLEGSIGQGGFSVGLKQTIVNGKGMRMDISAGGQTGYMIVTRDSGWTYMPFMGQEAPQQIPQEDIKMGRDKINFLYSQLLDKTQIESAKIDGKDTIEGNA
ncbi:MAG: hypothetical protein EBZ77_14590, partial [Chitinophagia bacterium]|nr:hypothetical protein [Chitinophagia bacterium]